MVKLLQLISHCVASCSSSALLSPVNAGRSDVLRGTAPVAGANLGLAFTLGITQGMMMFGMLVCAPLPGRNTCGVVLPIGILASWPSSCKRSC